MKRIILLFVVYCLFQCLFAATVFSEEVLYIQPFQAKIYAKPSVAAEILGSVGSGFQFVSSGREGRWVKLEYNGKPGYIPAVQAAKTPPLGKSATKNSENGQKLGARARTSSSSAVVAGMKGLTYEDRARGTKGERSDYEALDKADALIITQEELNQFKSDGGKR